jgi:hypothetical protein
MSLQTKPTMEHLLTSSASCKPNYTRKRVTRCKDTNKKRYATKLDAQIALVRHQSNTNADWWKQDIRREYNPIRYYKCPFCHGYHLTHQPMKVEQ